MQNQRLKLNQKRWARGDLTHIWGRQARKIPGEVSGSVKILNFIEVKWRSLNRVWLFETPQLYSQWNSPGQNTGGGIPPLEGDPFSRVSSHPGIEPRSPALQANSLPAELQRKPLNFINTLQINRRLMSYDINRKIRSSFTVTPFLSLLFWAETTTNHN